MPSSMLGKVMSSKPTTPIKQQATRLNNEIGGLLGKTELEVCARYFSIKKHRITYVQMREDCSERRKVLEEVRCLAAASTMR